MLRVKSRTLRTNNSKQKNLYMYIYIFINKIYKNIYLLLLVTGRTQKNIVFYAQMYKTLPILAIVLYGQGVFQEIHEGTS